MTASGLGTSRDSNRISPRTRDGASQRGASRPGPAGEPGRKARPEASPFASGGGARVGAGTVATVDESPAYGDVAGASAVLRVGRNSGGNTVARRPRENVVAASGDFLARTACARRPR